MSSGGYTRTRGTTGLTCAGYTLRSYGSEKASVCVRTRRQSSVAAAAGETCTSTASPTMTRVGGELRGVAVCARGPPRSPVTVVRPVRPVVVQPDGKGVIGGEKTSTGEDFALVGLLRATLRNTSTSDRLDAAEAFVVLGVDQPEREVLFHHAARRRQGLVAGCRL